eukprot:TRINITY_DN30346_c0_g1_i1.p1 TRINITY_DN30346_c0_g1~~TRINITY_DN30346_c0_g1_i1.p1  ORF type:complete len:236 (+),score=51.85 TRINITY_DN30346_c0_g1_i1:54-761(+)
MLPVRRLAPWAAAGRRRWHVPTCARRCWQGEAGPSRMVQTSLRHVPQTPWADQRCTASSVMPAPVCDDDDDDDGVPRPRTKSRRRRRSAAAAAAPADATPASGNYIWRVVWPAGTAWRDQPSWGARTGAARPKLSFLPCGSRGVAKQQTHRFVQDLETGLWVPLVAPDGARLTVTLPAPPPRLVALVNRRSDEEAFRRQWDVHCRKHGGGCYDPRAHEEQWLRDTLRSIEQRGTS